MRTEHITFITVQEIAAHLAKFFGVPSCGDWVGKMDPDSEWHPGTFHWFKVEPEERWDNVTHRRYLAAAKERGFVEWDCELIAILCEAAKAGDLPAMTYAVTLSDHMTIKESQRSRVVAVYYYEEEVEDVLKRVIGWDDTQNWVHDIQTLHYSNNTAHFFEVDAKAADLPENQALLAAAKARRKVVTHEELAAVLNEAAKERMIPSAPTIVQIVW